MFLIFNCYKYILSNKIRIIKTQNFQIKIKTVLTLIHTVNITKIKIYIHNQIIFIKNLFYLP